MLSTKPKPGKPGHGERTGTLTINCVRVTTRKAVKYHHYDVFPDKTPNRAKLQLIDALQRQQSNIFPSRASFDGQRNLYSPQELSFGATATFPVTIGQRSYQVQLTKAAVIDTGVLMDVNNWGNYKTQGLMAINLLNVVVKTISATREGAVANKSSYFLSDRHWAGHGSELEFWRGYYQSIRPTIRGLVMNVDTTVGLMYRRGNLLQALMDHLGVRDPPQLDPAGNTRKENKIKKFLKGLRVSFTHLKPSPTKSIKELAWKSANEFTFFNNSTNQDMSVAEYFASINHPLRYPTLRILVLIGKAAYPLEVMLIVPGQPYRGLMPERLQPEFITFSTQKPDERLRELQGSLSGLMIDSSYTRNAGIEADQNFITVDARVLPQPNLMAGRGDQIDWQRMDDKKKSQGAWDMMRRVAHKPASIFKVFFVLAAPDRRLEQELLSGALPNRFLQTWSSLGIGFETPFVARVCPNQEVDLFLDNLVRNDRDVRGALPSPTCPEPKDKRNPTPREKEDIAKWERAMQRVHSVLVVVFVQDSDKHKRESVKYWGDIEAGFPTQILKASKALKAGDQYIRNVGLKINAKMRGINLIPSQTNVPPSPSQVMFPEANTIIFGIDTAHPPPGSHFPTTAAVTYSIDTHGTNYRASVRFQQPRQEIVAGIKDMVREGLVAYERRNRVPPRRVIVYRDGVSEGQFPQVLKEEAKVIWDLLGEMRNAMPIFREKGWKQPELTFIVVGKRHHIRFLPDPRDQGKMQDMKRNALPGTVVDNDITTPDPKIFDFYLQSHGSLQGTSRPAHYSVLYDDFGFSAETLEKFSYDLCHVYQIATRSVSLPAPVYYADQVAARSGIHFHKVINSDTMSQRSVDTIGYADWELHFNRVKLHYHTRDRMYWL